MFLAGNLGIKKYVDWIKSLVIDWLKFFTYEIMANLALIIYILGKDGNATVMVIFTWIIKLLQNIYTYI